MQVTFGDRLRGTDVSLVVCEYTRVSGDLHCCSARHLVITVGAAQCDAEKNLNIVLKAAHFIVYDAVGPRLPSAADFPRVALSR